MPISPTGRNRGEGGASTGSGSPRAESRGGFTLVELSVVVLLIVVLAAAAAPSFAGFWRASQARNCAWQVAALARRARDYAICHGVRAAIEYDQAQRQFHLTAQGDADGDFEPLRLAGAQPVAVPEAIERVSLSVEGREAGPDWPIIFFPDGQALAAEILLEGPHGALTVTVAPLTGRTRVVEGDVREH